MFNSALRHWILLTSGGDIKQIDMKYLLNIVFIFFFSLFLIVLVCEFSLGRQWIHMPVTSTHAQRLPLSCFFCLHEAKAWKLEKAEFDIW